MEKDTRATVVQGSFRESLNAFEFVSPGVQHQSRAWMCIDTGQTWFSSDVVEEELPEDLETSDRYISVPQKKDLRLGRNLVMAFVDQEMPNDWDRVDSIF